MQRLSKLVVSLFLVFTLVFTGMAKPAAALTVASRMEVAQPNILLASTTTAQIAVPDKVSSTPSSADWKVVLIQIVVSYALDQIIHHWFMISLKQPPVS
jgi:hypothetical protein